MNATTTYIRYDEPTMCSQSSQAYSQCMPEPNYGHAPQPQYDYGSYYNEQAAMAQQPTPVQPMQAPVAQSSSAGMSLLIVAGIAVVGAAAFGGVLLMNSSSTATATATTAARSAVPAAASAPLVNLPQTVEVPAQAPQSDPASVPVIVNNSTPVRVSGPAVSASKPVTVPKEIAAPIAGPAAPALAPALAPSPAPDLAPAPGGVTVKAPGVEVGVPGQGGVSVKTPGVDVAVPGQGGGGVVVAVPGGTTKTDDTKKDETPKTDDTPKKDDTPKTDDTPKKDDTPAQKTFGQVIQGVQDGVPAAAANVNGVASG